ncbi:trans-sialidase, putative [Trypanosoma cruzi marinkellei]|uniref:Trans-sialidase, putative n=1 Tax=Trypanosoma cruzi marinkellei TaxID=85056 RepID=K2MV61_TRYCR|nr:trans-sialidase, putative [Trypanosoma cruzi marinkellei]
MFGLFRAPSLAYTKGAVLAIVEVHYTNTTDNKVCVGSAANAIDSDKTTRTKGSAIVFDHYDIKVDRLSRPTAVVYDGDIRALVGGYGNSGAPLTRVAGDDYWTPRMTEGEVPHYDEDENKKEFAWHRRVAPNLESFLKDLKPIPEHFKQFLGAGGGGMRLEDNSSVLPIHALKDNGKAVSLVILAKGFAYGWKFSKDTSPAGCIQPAVLAWKERKLVRMASREDGSRGVHTWDVMGESVDGGIRHSFTRVGQLAEACVARPAGGFVSATIDGQKVIHVSRPVYSETDGKETRRLHMWLSGLQRSYDDGPVSAVGENVAASTPLHSVGLQIWKDPMEERKLYCSYEVVAAEGGKYNVAFVDLTEKLEEVKKVVAAWKEKDAHISKEYRCGNKKDANKNRSDCDDSDLTKGLAGFLSNTSADSTWRDEYLCVNATVHGEVKSAPDGGLSFKGPGAGAEWPVGKMWGRVSGTTLRTKRFILVAPVSIHEVLKAGSSSSVPLMGVKLHDTGHTVLFVLSYTNENKWEVTFNGNTRNLSGDSSRGRAKHIGWHWEWVVMQRSWLCTWMDRRHARAKNIMRITRNSLQC